MKFTNKKRGFTIVELIIVIAVIAVLAAVLIPVFSGLIQQGKDAEAKVVVNTLNKGLAMTTTKPATMQSALEAVETNVGINVAKLDETYAKTGNKILWDSEYNTFLFVTKDGEKVSAPNVDKFTDKEINLWAVAKTTDDLKDNYSHYWYGGDVATVEVATGFDAGEAKIGTVNYVNAASAKNVTIRTNGGTLTVNAPNDTVTHYEKADKVVITAVAANSYHEKGEVVGNIEVTKGRVELAPTAVVNTILVASEKEGDVKVEVKSGATVTVVAPTTEVAKKDVVASTTVPAESQVQDVVVANDNFAGGLGTEKSPFVITTGTHFANINTLASEMATGKACYFKQAADITVSKKYTGTYFAGEYDGQNYSIVADLPNANWASLFHVYQTSGHVTFKNMNIVMSNVGVSLLACADWGTAYGGTFDNLTFNSTEKLVNVNVTNFGFVVIDALNTKGEGDPVYTFSNITNNVNLQNAGTCTGFIIGSGPLFQTKTTATFVNCVNNGTISGTSSVGFLYGNSSYMHHTDESGSTINVTNCKNNGIFKSPYENNPTVAFAPKYDKLNDQYQKTVGGSFIADNYLKDKTFTVKQNGTNFVIDTDDSNVSYKLAFNVAATYTLQENRAWTDADVAFITNNNFTDTWDVSNGRKYFIELPIDKSVTGSVATIKAYDKKTAQANGITVSDYTNGFAVVVKDGNTYLVFDTTERVYINSSVSLIVYAYDSMGNILGTKTVK